MPRLASTPPSITVARQPKRPTRMLHRGPVGGGRRGRDEKPASRGGVPEGGGGEAGKGFQQELTRRLKGHKPWRPQSWILMPTLPRTGHVTPARLALSLPQFPLLQNEGSGWGTWDQV